MRVWWLSAFAILWVGCESDKVSVDEGVIAEDTACEPGNYPPFVEITSPADASVIPDGTTETFEALVGDADDELSSLTVDWYADGELVCADAEIDFRGKTVCDIEVSGPTTVVRVEVTDPDDAQDEDFVVVTDGTGGPVSGNTPPECEITEPPAGTVGLPGETVRFAGIVSDTEDEPADLTVYWAADTVGELGSSVADESGGVSLDTGALGVGDHIVALYVSDTAGATCVDWIRYQVVDEAETDNPPVVEITDPSDDATFEEGDEIEFSAVVSDVEDDVDDLEVVWLSADGEVLSTEGPDADGVVTFATDAFDVGEQVITIQVTDSDGNTSTDSVTIAVEAAEEEDSGDGDTAAIDTGDVTGDGDAGETDGGSDGDASGGDDGATSGGEADGGATDDGTGTGGSDDGTTDDGATDGSGTDDGDADDGGADDGGADDGDADDGGADDGGERPVITDVNLGPDPAYTNDAMSCTPTAFTPGSSFGYRWEINGETVDASGSTLAASNHAKNDVVQCFATPYLGSEMGDEAESNIVVISNTPPTAPVIHIEPGVPEAEEALVCIIDEESTDLDDDVISYTFEWTVNGEPYSTATSTIWSGDTIPSGETRGGESWVCTVTPFDGEEEGPSDSDGVTVEAECPPLGGDGRDGNLNVDDTYTLMSVSTTVVGDNPAGGAALTVADASRLMAGDEVLVQATHATSDACDAGDAGFWQALRISSIDGNTLYTRDPLSDAINTSGGNRYQVVRIPQFSTVSVGPDSMLTAPAFNGETGGVLVFRAQLLELAENAMIDMTGRGFRGGSTDAGFAEHHGGRSAMTEGLGGAGGIAGAAAGPGDNGAGGGAGGGYSSAATGSAAGGGGGGMGPTGGAGGVGDTVGGQGGNTAGGTVTAGGGGGAASASVYPTCSATDGSRFVFGAGGQLGGGGGCANGGDGGASLGATCGDGNAGGAGGGLVLLLTENIVGAAGSLIVADGNVGGAGADGESALVGTAAGGGGAGNGGVGAGGGQVFIMSAAWGDGVPLIDARASGGSGGLGGAGGDGACVSGLVVPGGAPGFAGADAPDDCAGSGGGGAQGADGADGQVMVFGFGVPTPVTFPHTMDPVYGFSFDGGIECMIEM